MAIVGIDLGTSNSCIALVLNGRPQVVLDERGRTTTPSVISTNKRQQFFVGHLAKAQMLIQPELSIHSAKRLIGQRYSAPAVQTILPSLNYPVVPIHGDLPGIVLGEDTLSPTQVSSAILTKVKALAESAIGESVDKAVISVPAHFDNVQRTATKQAAEIAGLEVLRLINEPTAAALAYGFGSTKLSHIAIYDFGGGTFDISVLEIGDGVYNVLATGGDTFLGGDDFNLAIARWIATRFQAKTGIDPLQSVLPKQRILDAAEFAKVQLSKNDHARIDLVQLFPDIDPQLAIHEILTRPLLEELCQDLVQRSLQMTQKVIEQSGLQVHELDEIVLVGGMTRMPLIQQSIAKFFGRAANNTINPDEAIAIGAAIQAMALQNNSTNLILLDVVPLTLGIEAAGGIFIPIIKKNTKVPHRITRIFTTNQDMQEQVQISVFQGEDLYCKNNALLARFELSGIRKARRMEARIEVSFRIDVNGILEVSAIDLDTNQSQSIEIVDMSSRAIQALEQRELLSRQAKR